MRVRGYPDNLVNKVLAEVKFTETQRAGGALRDIQKTAAKETKRKSALQQKPH